MYLGLNGCEFTRFAANAELPAAEIANTSSFLSRSRKKITAPTAAHSTAVQKKSLTFAETLTTHVVMKRTLTLIGAAAASLIAVTAQAQRPEQRPAPTDFAIEVYQMNPTSYASQSVSPGYTLEVRRDSVFCHLPYVGQVYSANPSGAAHLEFAAPVRDWQVTAGRKGRQTVSFRCAWGAVSYSFRVTLRPGGEATVVVTPTTAQRISYDGDVIED